MTKFDKTNLKIFFRTATAHILSTAAAFTIFYCILLSKFCCRYFGQFFKCFFCSIVHAVQHICS